MLRSHVPRRLQDNGPVVSIYLPMLKEYIGGDILTTENEQDLKRAVKKAGGMENTSGLFLSTTAQGEVVNGKVGVNRRSVIQVPRSKVPPQALSLLDKCKLTKQVLSMENFFLVTVCNHKDCSTQVIDQDENTPPPEPFSTLVSDQDENIPPPEPFSTPVTPVSDQDDHTVSIPRYKSFFLVQIMVSSSMLYHVQQKSFK